MWQHQNKLIEQYFDMCIRYALFSYFYPLMLFGDLDEYAKTICLNGIKSKNN
jgi:hypothetical protein